MRMKKMVILCVLLSMMMGVFSSCGAPEPVEETPTDTPPPTQPPPTFFMPTPEPTITPRPIEGPVEWPEADATLLEIDPIDKPTRPPIDLGEYRNYESSKLRVSFNIPAYFGDPVGDDDPNTNYIVFTEPPTDIRSQVEGGAASVIIAASAYAVAQTKTDAENMVDAIMEQLETEVGNIRVSSTSSNKLLGIDGVYVTYWVNVPVSDEENAPTVEMRGRCLVVPVDKKLYMVRYLCPIEYNSDYENIYREIRTSFREL